ncbi:MAG TPA: hypothetical protein VHK47_05520, partial [Polyangia bacterium]|nr:hypothetical protein [Polyangia bacterium]
VPARMLNEFAYCPRLGDARPGLPSVKAGGPIEASLRRTRLRADEAFPSVKAGGPIEAPSLWAVPPGLE